MHETSLEQRLQHQDASLEYNLLGLAYVANDGTMNVMNSDRAPTHEYHARKMDEIVRDYVQSNEGKAFLDYAASTGHSFIQLIGAGAGDLGEYTVAAVIHDGQKGIIVSNYDGKDFSTRVQEFANKYGLRHHEALEYVLTHEFGHVAGYNTEAGNEGFIQEYFLHRAAHSEGAEQQKYLHLADVAGQRCKQAQQVEYKN